MRFLTGRRNSFLNTSTLLTAAGVVWGLFESVRDSGSRQTPPPSTGGPGTMSGRHPPPPPLPIPAPNTAPGAETASPEIPSELLRLVRLTISAARADGQLSAAEMSEILDNARSSGAEHLVEAELKNPKSLAEIVSGVSDPQVRADMYTLGYVIVRADEGVSGAERIYLAQLANHLGLDQETTRRLETEANAAIEQENERA